MFLRTPIALLAVMLAVPLTLHGQMQMRVDRSTDAADPDDVPEVTLEAMGSSFTVGTGPAVVVWDPGNTASGEYDLKGTFRLEEPSDHTNYYGLVFGASDLDNSSQDYLYFLVAQNGSFVVKRRAGDDAVHDIVGRTPHDAVATPGDDGKSVNEIEVRVGAEELTFVVNGVVVHAQARAGMASRTNGLFGVRVNHRMPGVTVEGLGVSH